MKISVYVYETRNLDYVDCYISKASINGITLKKIGKEVLSDNKLYNEFKSHYSHFSDNSYEFELQCFARYFALLAEEITEKQFVMSDSDIFITNAAFYNFQSAMGNENCLIASEGFDKNGSELQISPHFSFWSKGLLKNFVDYLIECYKKNTQTNYLQNEYLERKQRYKFTGISDMTMLYSWVKDRDIQFINTNKIKCQLGIDHNISSLYSADGRYMSFAGRKKIFIIKEAFFIKSTYGNQENMSIIHFQGRYKNSLKDFYNERYFLFWIKTMYINFGRKVRNQVKFR